MEIPGIVVAIVVLASIRWLQDKFNEWEENNIIKERKKIMNKKLKLPKKFFTGAGTCPVCGSADVSYKEEFLDDDFLYFPAKCEECGTTFREEYYVEYNRNTCIENEELNLYADNDTKEVKKSIKKR